MDQREQRERSTAGDSHASGLTGLLHDPGRLQWWLVLVVVLHSYAVMLMLLFIPRLTLWIGGFDPAESVFFVRQGGAFHGVVATGYWFEYQRYGTTSLAQFAKAYAVVFLLISWVWLDAAPIVLLAAVGDAAMGIALVILDRWVRR